MGDEEKRKMGSGVSGWAGEAHRWACTGVVACSPRLLGQVGGAGIYSSANTIVAGEGGGDGRGMERQGQGSRGWGRVRSLRV